jgi:putative DNA primase/helicase
VSSAAVIGRNLGGWRQGHNWRSPCPLGCGYALSLSNGEDGRLLAHCFGGCGFDEVMLALIEHGLFDDGAVVDGALVRPLADPHERDKDEQHRITFARRLYDEALPDERIGIYLRSRSISITSPVLRFSAEAPHRLGVRLPAMIAPIVNVNGEQTGVHLTFLRHDGSGKVILGSPEFQRECRGLIRGGAIRLAAHDPKRELVVGEGVETTLSAMQLFGLPGWSAIYAGGLKTIELPPAVRHIIIATDNDASGAGQRNALAAYERWAAEGRSVRLKIPPVVGDDFNDVLAKRQG